MKIFAIDDSELVLGMLQMICADVGHEFESSSSIPASIAADIVIVDLNIPGVEDSVESVQALHSGPIVVLSGLSRDELDALTLGVESWSKDLGMPGLHAKISSL